MRRKTHLFMIVLLCLFSMVGGATSAKAQEPQLSYDNLLIVEVYINRINTGETIEIYQHDGGYLIPLGLVSEIIDFSIDVNSDGGTANGWFLAENRIFSLDKKRGEVIVDGIRKSLSLRPVVVNYDDIYVDSSFFADWFGIDIALNFSDLALILKPREKLPVQLRIEREQLHEKIKRTSRKRQVFDIVENPYKKYDMPFIDAELGYNYSSDDIGDALSRVSYSVLSQGDLAYMTAQVAISGENASNQDEDSLTGFRFNLSREDLNGEMLGKMKAKSFELGDITAVSLPLTTTSGRGRGVAVSNVDLNRPDQFDSTDFIGDSQPGWEVEIYRNGVLQDFQLVGDDGSYEFRNVPIFFGNNIFRIVSYGPQGQVRERTERYNIDSSILQKGEFNYRLSADEKSRSIFGVDEEGRQLQHEPGLRLVGEAEYGITNQMTAGVGFARTPLDDNKFHEYNMFSIKNSFKGALTEVNLVYDMTDGGVATRFAGNTSLKGLRIRGEQSFYDDFTSEVERATSNQRLSTSKLDVDGSFNYLPRTNMSYRFGFEFEKFENNTDILTLSNRLSTSIYGIGFSNDLEHRETRNEIDTTTLTSGRFSVRGRHRDFAVRFNTDYDIDPLLQFKSFSLTTQKKVKKQTNVIVGIRKSLTDSKDTTINSSINRQFDKFTWSLTAQADTSDNISAGTRISFSLGKEPRQNQWYINGESTANFGAVSANAFLDNNYNDIFDDGDTRIPDVGFISGSRKFKGEGNKPAFVTRIPIDRPANVELDFASLDDPFWTPTKQGYSVVTRPGNVTNVDFPVIITTEIDGTVYLQKGDKVLPVSRVELELLDLNGKVVKTVKSEFDGFYIMSGVIPGEYILKVSEGSLERFRAVNADEKEMLINADDDNVQSNIDITIYGKSTAPEENVEQSGADSSELAVQISKPKPLRPSKNEEPEIMEKHCYEPGCYAPGVPSLDY